MQTLVTSSATALAHNGPPPGSALIRIADAADLLPAPMGAAAVLDCVFHDVTECGPGYIRPPAVGDALQIRDFAMAHESLPRLVVCCTAGVGRSQAVVAALTRIRGGDPRPIIRQGTYNRLLYRLLLESACVPIEPDPLVSMVVRVKYYEDRLQAFILCMERQRYENWEIIAVTDSPTLPHCVLGYKESVVKVITVDKPLGRWGHPYRQLGIDAARGEYIGLNNDDNLLCPGFLEQLVFAAKDTGYPMAACQMIHRYSGWSVVPAGTDLACWIAHRDLVRQAKWPGNEFTSDQDYFTELLGLAGGRCAEVRRPLVMKN